MKRTIALALMIGAASFSATSASAATETMENAANDQQQPIPSEQFAVDTTAASAATAVSVSAIGSADDAQAEHADGDWNVSFTPYLWVAGIKGDIGIPRDDGNVEIDKSFADILGNLKFAFMGALDVEHNRFVGIGDILYLNIGAEAESVDSPIFFEGEADAKLLMATAALGYRVVDQGPMFVDLFVGGRLVSLDVDLELTGPLQTRRRSASPSNISPLVGGRVRVPLGGRFALALYTDVGFDSEFKWQAIGTVQYDLGRHWRLIGGYRHLALHHNENDFEFDTALSGPIIGVSYKF